MVESRTSKVATFYFIQTSRASIFETTSPFNLLPFSFNLGKHGSAQPPVGFQGFGVVPRRKILRLYIGALIIDNISYRPILLRVRHG
jgi:hypothetical protein